MSKASLSQSGQLIRLVDETGWSAEAVNKYFIEKWGTLRDVGKALAAGILTADQLDELIHTVDCDAPPVIPHGLTIAESAYQIPSRVTGKIWARFGGINLHLDPSQMDESGIVGTELMKKLSGLPVLHPNILDHLLDFQERIPKDWQSYRILFPGLTFSAFGGRVFCFYMVWANGSWHWNEVDLVHQVFGPQHRTAVLDRQRDPEVYN